MTDGVAMTTNSFETTLELISKLLCSKDFDSNLEKLLYTNQLFLEKYAPFKVGDRVELAVTPEISEKTAPGWLGAKHFLKKGATGVVKLVDTMKRSTQEVVLVFHVEFDKETWKDRLGEEKPVEKKHTFLFLEKDLKKIEDAKIESQPGRESTRRVVCAAIRAADGEVLIGLRHYSQDMHSQIDARRDGEKFKQRNDENQGFVDQWGEYMTREEAYEVATKQGQIIRRVGCENGKLFSENLY